MNTQDIQGLKEAFALSPDNKKLFSILIDTIVNHGMLDEACELISQSQLDFDVKERVKYGRLCLKANANQTVLALCLDSAEECLLKAKACLAIDDLESSHTFYQRALEINPTCKDAQLEQSLSNVVQMNQKRLNPLRVVSNTEEPSTIESQRADVNFADVGGLETIKKQIHQRIILPFTNPSLFNRFKKRKGGGVLLYGPPGCGKTLIARATSGECKANFYCISIADVFEMWVGESEKKLQEIFEQARQNAPSVLFFDELEVLASKRDRHHDGATPNVISQFLAEMDGFAQNNQGVLVIGATNVPWAVDSAFKRSGRFDRVLFVPPPDRVARSTILDIHLKGRPIADDLNIAELVELTVGFSGADLMNLVETACDYAIEETMTKDQETFISQAHFRQALEDVNATTLEWLTTARNYAQFANSAGQYDDVLKFLEQHGK